MKRNYKKFIFCQIVLACFWFAIGSNLLIANGFPSKPEQFGNGSLEVIFDTLSGLPYKYVLPAIGDSYRGIRSGTRIKTIVKKTNGCTEALQDAIYDNIVCSGNDARVHYKTYYDSVYTGSFVIHYKILENSKWPALIVVLDDVNEVEGYHLIEVKLNSLVSIFAVDGPSSFIFNRAAGRIVKLTEAKAGNQIGNDDYAVNYGGYPNTMVFPVTAFIKPKSACIMEVTGYINNTQINVSRGDEDKSATMAVLVPYRVRGGICTPDLLVNQPDNICRIDFTADYDNNGTINWLDAAKLKRDNMPPIPTRFFDDKFVIIDNIGREGTWNTEESFIRRISNLIDGNPFILFTSSPFEGGHDINYPNYTEIAKSTGGEKLFMSVIENVKQKYNCTLSINDNLDDQYRNQWTKGFFDLANISRNPDGTPVTGPFWSGYQSYITGMAKYMKDNGQGMAKIDYLGGHYKIKDAILFDVLSSVALRHDWDPVNPASAYDNLVKGKFKAVEMFREKYGINVVSELLMYPFIGEIALTVDGFRRSPATPADGDIPFASLSLRNSIIYGGEGGGGGAIADPKELLFNNKCAHTWVRQNAPDYQITDLYYFNFLPWMKVHSLDILTYTCTNNVVDMILSQNTEIHIDFNNNSWYVNYRGKRIWTNYEITCPIDESRIAFYSRTAKELKYPMPAGIKAGSISAKVLTNINKEDIPVNIKDGQIVINVPAQQPVIVNFPKGAPLNR